MGCCQQKILQSCFLIWIFFMLGCVNMSKNDKSIAEFYGFPLYPELTHLCGKRVYVSGSIPQHLTWDAFASAAPPAAIVEHYRLKLGDGSFSKENGGGTWRMPAGAEPPARVLDIYPVGQPGPHEECEKKPPPGSRSIVLFSRMP